MEDRYGGPHLRPRAGMWRGSEVRCFKPMRQPYPHHVRGCRWLGDVGKESRSTNQMDTFEEKSTF